MYRASIGAKSQKDFAAVFTGGIGKFQGKVRDALIALGLVDSANTINLPSFLPLLIRESTSGKDFLNVLFQIRDEASTTELRGMLSHMQESIAKGDYRDQSKLSHEIEKVGRNILLERGIEKRFITISPPTTILGISITGDDTGIKLPIPSVLYKQYFLGRRYRAFVKRVMEELAIPTQYGALKDKLNGYAWIKGERFPKFYLKQDQFPSKFHKKFGKSSFS